MHSFTKSQLKEPMLIYVITTLLLLILTVVPLYYFEKNIFKEFPGYYRILNNWNQDVIVDIKRSIEMNCEQGYNNLFNFDIQYLAGCVSTDNQNIWKEPCSFGHSGIEIPGVELRNLQKWGYKSDAGSEVFQICIKRLKDYNFLQLINQFCIGPLYHVCNNNSVNQSQFCLPINQQCPMTLMKFAKHLTQYDQQIKLGSTNSLFLYQQTDAYPIAEFKITDITGVCLNNEINTLSISRKENILLLPPTQVCDIDRRYKQLEMPIGQNQFFIINSYSPPILQNNLQISDQIRQQYAPLPSDEVIYETFYRNYLKFGISCRSDEYIQLIRIDLDWKQQLKIIQQIALIILCVQMLIYILISSALITFIKDRQQRAMFYEKSAVCLLILSVSNRFILGFSHFGVICYTLSNTMNLIDKIGFIISENCVDEISTQEFIQLKINYLQAIPVFFGCIIAIFLMSLVIECYIWKKVWIRWRSKDLEMRQQDGLAIKSSDSPFQQPQKTKNQLIQQLQQEYEMNLEMQQQRRIEQIQKEEIEEQLKIEQQIQRENYKKIIKLSQKQFPIYNIEADKKFNGPVILAECVICLENDPPPLYTKCCGQPLHKNCNPPNLKNCPCCRHNGRPILEAFIRNENRAFKQLDKKGSQEDFEEQKNQENLDNYTILKQKSIGKKGNSGISSKKTAENISSEEVIQLQIQPNGINNNEINNNNVNDIIQPQLQQEQQQQQKQQQQTKFSLNQQDVNNFLSKYQNQFKELNPLQICIFCLDSKYEADSLTQCCQKPTHSLCVIKSNQQQQIICPGCQKKGLTLLQSKNPINKKSSKKK